MLAETFCAGLCGIEGFIVTVETDAQHNIPAFELVGLPDMAVKEAKERVQSACVNSGFRFPEAKLTVNLAPADRRKEGSCFDTAILLGILQAGGAVPHHLDFSKKCFVGELSLSGELRAIHGVLCMCVAAKEAGFEEIYVPEDNAAEAAAVSGITVFPIKNARQLVRHLTGEETVSPAVCTADDLLNAVNPFGPDFADVRGQALAKRAMEIAAAGGHNILLIGPPGTGKSMLAKRLPTILPPLSFDEAIETTKIHSVAGTLPGDTALMNCRPFRSPHHTMSAVSLVGGGINPMPGEISLANNGVLFLDELPEFPKSVTDALRQPLEDRRITITRANGRVTFPCSFMMVAAMNPCRCGYFGHPTRQCTCKPDDVRRYISRVSGPMLDRIDIQIELPAVSYAELSAHEADGETSAVIRDRVVQARTFARNRMQGPEDTGIFCNAQLDAAGIRRHCRTDEAGAVLLKQAYQNMGMSARGYDRILRVARTIADLDSSELIRAAHIGEAIQLRSLDRKYWG